MTSMLIPRDFNLVIGETDNLYGKLETTTTGGIEVQRADFMAGGAILDRRPITGFKFKMFKWKMLAYPDGMDSLPVGEQVSLSWSEYIVDEDSGKEVGVRHFYKGEIDTPNESDRKQGDLVTWDYELANTSIYRKYKDDVLIDEGDRKKNTLILNKKRVWVNRNRILQLGNS